MESVLLFIAGVLVVVIGVALSIAIHELGHLVPAKKFGVRVTRYMVGFGPTLWSRRRGETEYGVKLLPLGGYIAMSGMFPPRADGTSYGDEDHDDIDVQEGRDGTTSRSPWKAVSAEQAASPSGVSQKILAELVQEGSTTPGAGGETSETPPSPSRAFYRLPVWKKLIIMFGGPFMNLVFGTVLLGIVTMGFGVVQATTVVSSVGQCIIPESEPNRRTCQPGDQPAPAAQAGLTPGDRITAIDGVQMSDWATLTQTIRDNPGKQLRFTIERSGKSQDLTVTPALVSRPVVDGKGAPVLDSDGKALMRSVGYLGIDSARERVQQPITALPGVVFDTLGQVTNAVIGLPARLVGVVETVFGNKPRDVNGPIGIVGVGRIAGEVAATNEVDSVGKISALVSIVASLNFMLFVFNLVPLLPLDGGHMLGAIIEGVRRWFARLRRKPDPGPVDLSKLLPITFTVAIILGAMTILLIYADIFNPVKLF